MKVFKIVFIIIGLYCALLLVTACSNKKPKEIIKKLFEFILYKSVLLLGAVLFIGLFILCYKIVRNLLVTGILTVVISLIICKFIFK